MAKLQTYCLFLSERPVIFINFASFYINERLRQQSIYSTDVDMKVK